MLEQEIHRSHGQQHEHTLGTMDQPRPRAQSGVHTLHILHVPRVRTHIHTVSYAAANPTALMTKRVGQGCVALLLVGIAVRLCASWYSGWGEMLVNRTELATPMDRLSLCTYTNTHSHGQCVNNGICCMIWTLMPRIYGAL